jgi:hypothetical protein
MKPKPRLTGRLSRIQPEDLPASRAAAEPHNFTCPICGDTVDRGDLGSMMLHERPAHRSRRVSRDLEREMERHISGRA